MGFNKVTVEKARNNVKDSIIFLSGQVLDPAQKKKILDVINNKKILAASNLIDIKVSMKFLESELADTLKDLDLKVLENLVNAVATQKQPVFLKNTVALAKIYKQINEDNYERNNGKLDVNAITSMLFIVMNYNNSVNFKYEIKLVKFIEKQSSKVQKQIEDRLVDTTGYSIPVISDN